MKQFSCGGLALAALALVGRASDTGWSGLDREIDSLSTSLAQQASTGPKIGGYIIVSADYQDGDDIAPGAEDITGVRVRFARIVIKGDVGHDYSYTASFDIASNTVDGESAAALRDAYVDWKITDGIKGRLGQFKLPSVRSALISDEKLLFLQRTLIGTRFAGREVGAMVAGQFETVNFWINAQNEATRLVVGDGQSEDMVVSARVTVDILGDGLAGNEGAYGAGDVTSLVVGGVVGDDQNAQDGMFLVLEAALTSGRFSVAAEMADFDEDIGDNTPWDATGSFLFSDMYEAAVRYEDFDDAANTTKVTGGVNRYVAGHGIKWTLQWEHTEADGSGGDTDAFALGLVLAY